MKFQLTLYLEFTSSPGGWGVVGGVCLIRLLITVVNEILNGNGKNCLTQLLTYWKSEFGSFALDPGTHP